MLVATVVGALAGVALGLLIRQSTPRQQAIELIGFPGELMLRLLKLLVLPLVSISITSGVCSLRRGSGGAAGDVGRLARYAFAYYAACTAGAIALGLLLVTSIRPGRGAPFDALAAGGACGGTAEAPTGEQSGAGAAGQGGSVAALLGALRQLAPDNIVGAAADMNVLGIITFSAMFGLALASLGAAADGVIATIQVLDQAVGRMVAGVLWLSPVGVGSLIAASILRACDLGGTVAALGLWMVTVLLGLAIFALVVLPTMLLLVTGRSPLAVASHFSQALLLAFGTSSSAAALPAAMQAAKDLGCDEATVSFFLPLGVAINLSGTALYEATTAVFIAQAHGVALGAEQLLLVAFTASLAAVGAPAIPSAGLVTMLIVLQSVGLARYAADLASILAVDWLLDRVRTAVNLLGDAYGAVAVDALLQGRRHASGAGAGGGGKAVPYVQLSEAGASLA